MAGQGGTGSAHAPRDLESASFFERACSTTNSNQLDREIGCRGIPRLCSGHPLRVFLPRHGYQTRVLRNIRAPHHTESRVATAQDTQRRAQARWRASKHRNNRLPRRRDKCDDRFGKAWCKSPLVTEIENEAGGLKGLNSNCHRRRKGSSVRATGRLATIRLIVVQGYADPPRGGADLCLEVALMRAVVSK
jgi:hypothetical protein